MKHIVAWSWQHDSNGLPPIRGPNDLNRYFLLELDWTMLYWASCWNFTMFVNFSLSHRSIPFLSTQWIPIIGFLYRNLPQNQCLPNAQVWCSCGTFPLCNAVVNCQVLTAVKVMITMIRKWIFIFWRLWSTSWVQTSLVVTMMMPQHSLLTTSTRGGHQIIKNTLQLAPKCSTDVFALLLAVVVLGRGIMQFLY